jgi:hypothetical protein
MSKPLSETTMWTEQFIVINDNLKRLARDFYIKQKEGERDQDS